MSTDESSINTEQIALLEKASSEGALTQVTQKSKEIIEGLNLEGKSQKDKVLEIIKYVSTLTPNPQELENLQKQDPSKAYDKRSRSADQLLDKSNLMPNRGRALNISGCIETGHIERTLLLAAGIPALYTEGLKTEWIEKVAPDFDPSVEGSVLEAHVFLDIYLEDEDKWITVDSTNFRNPVREYKDYARYRDGERYEYTFTRTAKDSADMGYTSTRDFTYAVAKYFNPKLRNEPQSTKNAA